MKFGIIETKLGLRSQAPRGALLKAFPRKPHGPGTSTYKPAGLAPDLRPALLGEFTLHLNTFK